MIYRVTDEYGEYTEVSADSPSDAAECGAQSFEFDTERMVTVVGDDGTAYKFLVVIENNPTYYALKR